MRKWCYEKGFHQSRTTDLKEGFWLDRCKDELFLNKIKTNLAVHEEILTKANLIRFYIWKIGPAQEASGWLQPNAQNDKMEKHNILVPWQKSSKPYILCKQVHNVNPINLGGISNCQIS